MLQFKNPSGVVIDKTAYHCECGDVYYNEKKVGVFELESDSALGSYYHITLDNGKEFHDHYFDEKDIIKHI